MHGKIAEALKNEQRRLLDLAEECAGRFWEAHYDHKADPKTRGRLGLRVRKQQVGVAAHWFTASF